ncbi:MAG: hypothetical protein ABEJ65_09290 [bacterium]
MNWIVLGCAICFGDHDPSVTYVLMGMLALPFTMVGGMFTFLYIKGVFHTQMPEDKQPETTSQ